MARPSPIPALLLPADLILVKKVGDIRLTALRCFSDRHGNARTVGIPSFVPKAFRAISRL
jgi:hypothetical protein